VGYIKHLDCVQLRALKSGLKGGSASIRKWDANGPKSGPYGSCTAIAKGSVSGSKVYCGGVPRGLLISVDFRGFLEVLS
jgi:hypothetical protein